MPLIDQRRLEMEDRVRKVGVGQLKEQVSFDQVVANLCDSRNHRRLSQFGYMLALTIILFAFVGGHSGDHHISSEEMEQDITFVDPNDVEDVEEDVPLGPWDDVPSQRSSEKSFAIVEPFKPKSRNKETPILEPDPEAGPISEEKRDELFEKWGAWNFFDGNKDARPDDDFVNQYPNKDIPGGDFPQHSWQTDAVYVNHFLHDADSLITRAMEAIFSEYGNGRPLPPQQMAARAEMFRWERIDMATSNEPPVDFREKGGWTTNSSFDGLVRRLLHAIMTRDTFTVVLAGDMTAAGYGNHFHQSYAMQFHRIMKPVMERLGVTLVTRNLAHTGPTLASGLGARDLYGRDIDLFLWDSNSEQESLAHIDLVMRQVILSGNRVPLILGGPFELLKLYNQEAGIDVGAFGNGLSGIPVTTDAAQSFPWAVRNLKCASESRDLCDDDKLNAVCWVDRPDGIKPSAEQLIKPPSEEHATAGWRTHQLISRVLVFTVLDHLNLAVNAWIQGIMTGLPLNDNFWHVTEYYDNMREKMRNIDIAKGHCKDIINNDHLPQRICKTSMNGRSQSTPRADYIGASLTSIVKPSPSGYVPKNERVLLYEGPDVHNPAYDISEGEIDVLSIVLGRRRLEEETNNSLQAQDQSNQADDRSSVRSRRLTDNSIVPTEGWQVFGEPQGICDGAYDSVCAHSSDEPCFLVGHHAGVGSLVSSGSEDWIVMTLKGLKEGIIILKLNQNSLNFGKRRLGESPSPKSSNRILASDLPESFVLDYGIDETITTLDKTSFLANKRTVGFAIETLTILNDPDFTKGEAKDVDVGLRLTGVAGLGVSHVYWA